MERIEEKGRGLGIKSKGYERGQPNWKGQGCSTGERLKGARISDGMSTRGEKGGVISINNGCRR